MLNMPRRIKRRKQFRGRLTGKATRGNKIAYGEYGLVALEPCWLTTNQVEARRILNTDFMQSLMQLNIKLKDFGLVIDRKNMCLSLKNRNLFDFDEIKLGDNLEKMFEGCYNDACFIKILIEYVIKKNILLN